MPQSIVRGMHALFGSARDPELTASFKHFTSIDRSQAVAVAKIMTCLTIKQSRNKDW